MARIIDGNDKNMVGGKIRQLRIENNLSQQQLSDRLETLAIYICRGSISRIEEILSFTDYPKYSPHQSKTFSNK